MRKDVGKKSRQRRDDQRIGENRLDDAADACLAACFGCVREISHGNGVGDRHPDAGEKRHQSERFLTVHVEGKSKADI